MTTKPIILPENIWGHSLDSNKLISPSSTKIRSGWTFEDKPSFQEWNWFLNLLTNYLVYINEQGISEFSDIEYPVTGITKYDNKLYQCISPTSDVPSYTNRKWRSFETSQSIMNVNIDLSQHNDVMFFYKESTINLKITQYPLNQQFGIQKYIPGITLPDENTVDNLYKSAPLSDKKYFIYKNPSEASGYELKSINDIIRLKGYDITNINNVQIDNPNTDDVLTFDYSIQKWVNKPFIDVLSDVSYSSIKNIKDLEVIPASETVYGGMKIYCENNNLYITTE